MDDAPGLTQARIDDMTARGLWPDRTVLDYLADNLASRPDQTVVTDHNSATGRSSTLSYRHLDRISRRIAAGLAGHGIGKGDVVAIQLPNWWEFAAIHLACMRIGAITNPLMPIFREHELEFMLGFAGTRAIVVPARFRGFDYEPMIDGLRPSLPDLEHVFVVGGEGDTGFETRLTRRAWEDEADTEALFAERRVAPNEIIHYCYTSGTSGQPKAVMHTYNTLLGCLGGAQVLELDERLVVLMGSPLAHQTGFLFGMLLPITLGARTVLMDIWNADFAAKVIAEEGVTLTMGATPFLADLTECGGIERHRPDSLDIFISAGAPIPRPLVSRAGERLGAHIVAGWGMSENGLVSATRRGDADGKVVGTDGKPWQGMELRIVDEAGEPLPADTEGRLQARGAANFVGYLKRPEAYEVDAAGWFETGDNARMDGDGYVTITGRAKDIIIRGGENIPVVEVETLLYKHPAVREAAVVAVPDARLGERAALFAVLADGAQFDLAAMRKYLDACRLARQYWPEQVHVVPDMPRTPSGKVQKFRLRELAAELAERTA